MGGIDIGSTIGSYIGLLFLGAVFTAVGVCMSSFTNNTVVAFIAAAFVCFILYSGFDAVSQLPLFAGGVDYYIQMLGINFHYKSISRGVIDTRDVLYFLAVIALFLVITQRNVMKR
jgi:ABC-2 type transport system permease protein